LKHKLGAVLAVLCVLLVLPTFAPAVSAQESANYYVTVSSVLGDAPQYISIGKTAMVPFEARWTYGPNQGKFIENATATIEVKDQKGELVDTISTNTTTGVFHFNYTQNKPKILVFNATEIVTQNGQEWNLTFADTASSALVYWDTFHVSLVSYDADSLGKLYATVNATRLLLPEEGLKVGDKVIPKIAEGINVTINGVLAQEMEPGIYAAASSTCLPTAYINVKVSSSNWTTAVAGFSFTQYANQPFWIYGATFAAIFTFAVLLLRFFVSKKTKGHSGKQPNYPLLGAVTLIATCIISLYWTFVALEGILHTFDWIILAVFGGFAATLGFVGTVMLLRKKNPALVIIAVLVPMIMNTLAVNASLGLYQLANPWILLFGALFLSIVSAILISGTEELFRKQAPNVEAL
jgi:hypothetical protein